MLTRCFKALESNCLPAGLSKSAIIQTVTAYNASSPEN